MNFLIVDDSEEKSLEIQSVILSIFSNEVSPHISIVSNLAAARKQLTTTKFDVLVLDIELPQSSGSNARIDVGLDFIAELHDSPIYPIPTYTIVITAYDEAMAVSEKQGNEGIYAWIQYDQLGVGWRDSFRSRILYLSNILTADHTDAKQYDFDFAIVVALEDIELDSVLDLDCNWSGPTRKIRGDPTSYYFGEVRDKTGKNIRILAAAAPQMGTAAMSVLCMKIIQTFRPKYIGMPGIAAGVKKEKNINFGDVLVADLSWDYGSGKIRIDKGKTVLAPDPRSIYLDPTIKNMFVDLKRDRVLLDQLKLNCKDVVHEGPLNLHIGPIASGSAVVADEKIVSDIVKQHRKLIGIEMEIYGLYFAAANCIAPRPKVFALKSICDYGDREKDDKYQPYAAFTSAQILYHMVTQKLDF